MAILLYILQFWNYNTQEEDALPVVHQNPWKSKSFDFFNIGFPYVGWYSKIGSLTFHLKSTNIRNGHSLINFLGHSLFNFLVGRELRKKNYYKEQGIEQHFTIWKYQTIQYITLINSLKELDRNQCEFVLISCKYSPRFLLDRHMILPQLDTWPVSDSLVVTERSTARSPCVHTGSEQPPARCHYIPHICICRQQL